MNLTQSDIDIATRTTWAEARGEPYEGKVAVARVMVNRWRSGQGQFAKDDTLATACLRHVQFSCWTIGDPNFVPMQKVGPDDAAYVECMSAVLDAIRMPPSADPTEGALHYHTTNISPPWTAGRVPCAVIGAHQFYNDVP